MDILDLLKQMEPDSSGHTPDIKELAKKEIAKILDGDPTDSKPLEVEKPEPIPTPPAHAEKGREQVRHYGVIVKKTEKAILFSDSNALTGFWLPKKHCDVNDSEKTVRFAKWIKVKTVKIRKGE